MIWILASFPFWAIAIMLFAFGFLGLIYGLFSRKVDAEEFGRGLPGVAICLIGSGLFAIIAAKICS